MNPMEFSTPEERRARALKGAATRRANKAAADQMRADAKARIVGLKDEIAGLESRRDALQLQQLENAKAGIVVLKDEIAGFESRRDALQLQQLANAQSVKLSGKTLLAESDIIKGGMPWAKVVGIYFLISNGRVVYVGQSVDVFGRLSTHQKDKTFDAVAYVPCETYLLDKMESLYIHTLRPCLNGNMSNGCKLAPLALDTLLSA